MAYRTADMAVDEVDFIVANFNQDGGVPISSAGGDGSRVLAADTHQSDSNIPVPYLDRLTPNLGSQFALPKTMNPVLHLRY